jgi:heptosyltransferase-2
MSAARGRAAYGLIVAPNWLGDAVMSLAAVRALRAAEPERRWTVAARARVAPVYELARLGVGVVTLPERAAPRIVPQPEMAVVFPNSFHAALLAWRSGAPRRIGYAGQWRGALLRPAMARAAPGELPGHESYHYLELLRRAGLIAALPPEAELHVPLRPEAAAVAQWRERFGGGRLIAIHAGATFGGAKRWLPERFAAVAAALAAEGAAVALIGGGAEREAAQQVADAARAPGTIHNLAGDTTLAELAALLAAAHALVANDSGPMHLAAAVGTPVVALFGSTNERETYPVALPGRLRLLKAPGVACSPCKLRECPIDHRCMTRIEVGEVLRAVAEVA